MPQPRGHLLPHPLLETITARLCCPGSGMLLFCRLLAVTRAQPIVLGAIWNGEESPSETVGGDNTDRWVITSRAGTRIAIIEESGGQPLVEITTPAGPMITLSDEGGGRLI